MVGWTLHHKGYFNLKYIEWQWFVICTDIYFMAKSALIIGILLYGNDNAVRTECTVCMLKTANITDNEILKAHTVARS